MKYFIKTFGCQMNVYDSKRICDILDNLGYEETKIPSLANLILFNTCHIREKAADKVFSDLGRAKIIKEKREKKGLETIIGVIGCVAQAEDEEIAKRAPYVNFTMGPLMYHHLPEVLLKTGRAEGKTIIKTEFPAEAKFDVLPENTSQGGSAFLAIQEGCDNFCTYCVVPYTRGAEYSRPIKDIIKEANKLVETGSLEINLLGQNVNSFHGVDENGKEKNLAYLINKLADEVKGLKRIRYTTSYPSDVDEDLINCHKNIDILMPYLHLPIQAGSNKVLKAMNREYTSEQYLELIEKLHNANPKIGFSSDFIVGFPGETDEDFQKTLDVVNQIKFIQAYSFKYSKRPGTPAAVFNNQVPEKIKEERLQILQDLLFSHQLNFNKESIGKIMPVLFDMEGRNQGQIVGRTPYMQNLHTNLDNSYMHKIVDVRVVDATVNSLTGEIIK